MDWIADNSLYKSSPYTRQQQQSTMHAVSSFLRSNIKTIQDIWDENSKQFIDCDLLYSQLIDRRNCISEYSKIKKCIPKDYLKFLKNENNDIDNKLKVEIKRNC